MKNNNPTLRDPVAYRIINHPHPRTGNKWKIYPTYDFTHCICDSVEGITHSLCSLEFEVRRELYYWTLDKLNIWKPSVWEFSRLNITYSFLSKRKILKLVKENHVDGWEDPRLFTLMGLRRRGYSPDIINKFVDLIGVSRKGNDNFVSIKVLEHVAREVLDEKCIRTMAIIPSNTNLTPYKIIINNLPESLNNQYVDVPLHPKNKEFGNRKILITNELYIKDTDWRDNDDKNYFGLSFNKKVGLK